MQCEPLHISLHFAFVAVGGLPLDCLAEGRRPVLAISVCIKSGPSPIPHRLSDPAPPAWRGGQSLRGAIRPPLTDRKFADSLLEGDGFEPVWGFSCQVMFLVCCRLFVRSGKAVPRPVACDQVRGARGEAVFNAAGDRAYSAAEEVRAARLRNRAIVSSVERMSANMTIRLARVALCSSSVRQAFASDTKNTL